MENTGLKGLGVTLWQRVVISYKSTLLGIAVAIVAIVAENLVNSPNKVLTIIGAVLGSVLALIKEKPSNTPPLS